MDANYLYKPMRDMGKDEKKSFVMYDSFLEAARMLDGDAFKEYIYKLRDFALEGKDEPSENPIVNGFFIMAKPNLTKARERYESAKERGKQGAGHG
jgi:hypothetical protein